jgi:hypothetical protein
MKTQRLLIFLTVFNFVILFFVLFQNRGSEAQSVAPVLRGKALEIVDERGKVRASIKIEPATTMRDGKKYPEAAVFRVTDPSGLIRVKLAGDQDGSGIVLLNDSQEVGVQILANKSDSFLKLRNKSGREQIIKP